MTDEERTGLLNMAADGLYARCREEGRCVCGEPWGGHDYNCCLEWIRRVRAEFLRRCDEETK